VLTNEDYTTRKVTQAEVSRLSGIPRSSIAWLKAEGVIDGQKLDMADALSLLAAQELVDLGVPVRDAALVAHSIKGEWPRVVQDFPAPRYLAARLDPENKLVTTVCDQDEVTEVLSRGVMLVNLPLILAQVERLARASGVTLP
jgi:hypothetical protein